MPAGIVGGFVASRFASEGCPDIQFHAALASFSDPAKRVLTNSRLCLLVPASFVRTAGGIRIFLLQTQNRPPDIDPRYLDEEIDRLVLVEGMKIARHIMGSDPIKAIVKAEARPGKECVTDDELLDFAKQTGNTVYHPVSTCRMGPQISLIMLSRRI